jgi:L-proline amide hydrolase
MAPPEVEGYIEYSVPNAGKPCKTWYRVVGDLKAGTRPLVHLHGGPGCPYNIAASLADLTSSYGIPVIFYDQMGTGLSTHLPEKRGDASFWNVELFLRELDLVLTHLGVKDDYDLLGHSWGGMLGACHAAAQPPGLKRLVLSSSPAASRLWTEAQLVLRSELPQDMQAVLKKHEDAGTTNSKEHKSVMDFYYSQHLCRLTPWPADVMTAVKGMMEDDSVFMTMCVCLAITVIGS